MANKRQRKKNGKKSYQGQQYRGGREKGRKNLIYRDGGIYNTYVDKEGKEHHTFFTLEEKKALETAVNRATKKRRELLQAEAQLPRFGPDGKPTGDTVATLQLMGRESDFILTPKTKSLQRFRTHEQYERYMDYLNQVNQPDYIDNRIRLYKKNHMKAIKENLGDAGILMKIRMMPIHEYAEFVSSHEDVMEIHFIYGADAKQAKINQIRLALGMKIKEEPPIDSEFLE